MDQESNIAPPSESPQTLTPKSNKKLLFILGGILMAFILFTAGFFLGKFLSQPKPFLPRGPAEGGTLRGQISPTPTQPIPTPTVYTEQSRSATANWKTYTNKTAKYEIRYPIEITVEEIGDPKSSDCLGLQVDQARLTIKSPEGNYGGCVVTGLDYDPSAKTISETIRLLGKDQVISGMNKVSARLGKKETERFEFLTVSDAGGIKGLVIEISGYYDETNKDSYQIGKKKIYKILSTFQFLD